MALFELDDGRLVPAQFGRVVDGGMTPDVLAAVRTQVLEIVSRPLLPIAWRNVTRPHSGAADHHRLTALDASGQVVAVEVVENLDSELLIDSLSQLSDAAGLSWMDLAAHFDGGVEGFRAAWAYFRQSMPASPPNGPRLVIVAAKISADVRPALDLLSSSGVEVHELSLRKMSNGRAFLDVSMVGPRMYGHRANLLESASISELSGAGSGASGRQILLSGPPTATVPVINSLKAQQRKKAEDSPQSDSGPRRERRAQASGGQRKFPSRRKVHPSTGAIPILQQEMGRGPDGLRLVASMLGEATPLSLSPAVRTPHGATLQTDGNVSVPAGTYADPTEALQASGFQGEDGWEAWHLGDQYGPTLGEALAEINRSAGH